MNTHVHQELYGAWSSGNKGRFEELVNAGGLILEQPINGRTVLWLAAAVGSAESIHVLLKKGANVRAKCETTGMSPLHAATRWGHPAAVEATLSDSRATPDEVDNYAQTPLMRTALDGNVEIANLLLKSGCNVNMADCDRRTALMLAANQGRSEMVGLLLQNKANPDLQDEDGITALMRAKNAQICQQLLEAGADTLLTDKSGKTVAERMANRPAILELLNAHASEHSR